MKLLRLQTYEEVVEVLQRADAPVMFFTQAQILHTFFNKEGFEFYCVESEGDIYFFMKKLRTNELRFLFVEFPEAVVVFLKKEFSPPYIAYNQVLEDPHNEHQIEEIEVVVDVDRYIGLDDKRIRKHYHQAVRSNTHLAFKEFKDIPRKDLEEFWVTWAADLASRREKFSDRTENDQRFFDLYDDSTYFGIAAYDGKKLVAYSIGLHHSEGYCLSAFNKSLRGYTNLGLQVSYEKAKQAAALGYTQMNLAWINNDFKKQFLSVANPLTSYSFELSRNEDFKTFTPHGYTGALLR